ncbi:MAG: hypothetical protein ACKOYL_08465, partial [Actinomycetota bacterium]
MTDLAAKVDQPAMIEVVLGIPEACYKRSTIRGLSYVARDAAVDAVLLFALITVDAWWAVPLLWLATGLCISGIFVIGHDASHNALFDSKRLNAFVAKLALLP